MKEALQKLTEGKGLSLEESIHVANKLFVNETTEIEIASLLIALKAKGESVDEIAGLVQAVRQHATTFTTLPFPVMDNCGTGGDGSQSFNISTTAAFVIAGAGIPIAKHGNRSVSSQTGSADVLEHLGVSLNLQQEEIKELLIENGIAFLFAPTVHPQLKRILNVRKTLKIPTIFNLIGPLTNPLDIETQMLGTYRRDMLETMANVLNKLGRKRAVVINGAGYMDEASLAGENHLAFLNNGKISSFTIHPEEIGLPLYGNDEIKGGHAKDNADITLRVLKGEKGAYRDTVLFNAGIAIFANGLATSIEKGIEMAEESIDSGSALEKLIYLINYSKRSRSTKGVMMK